MTTPVVGRDAQLAELDGILGRALAGDAVICLVTGEPGAGKTSLVARFAETAQSRIPDLLVAVGACDAYTGAGDPYLPFRDILRQLTGDVERSLAAGRTTREGASRLEGFAKFAGRTLLENGADLVDLFVPGGALLTRLGGKAAGHLPWLQRLQGRLYDTPRMPTAPTLQQENVFEQYVQVLEAMAAERPLLLVVDDLHWADSASLSLLFHLARRLAKSRILLVGTYRTEEISRLPDGKPHPLQGVVAELKRLHGEVTLDLDNLGAMAFVDALLDARPNALDASFRESLARHTAGNPLFAVELLQSLAASGVLVEDPAGRLVQAAPVEWGSLPSRVAGVIESSIARLSAIQRDLLSAAAIQGEEFLADLVAEVVRADRRDVIRELSGPLQRELKLVSAIGLQEVAGRRVARYRFRHNVVQDYLYRQLDEIECGDLHGVTGLALEALHAGDPTSVAVPLVSHFTAAGDWQRAIRYRLLAAEVAGRGFAHEQMVEHLEKALELDDRHCGGTVIEPCRRAAITEGLGDGLLLLRRWERAQASYHAGMERADPQDRVTRARLVRKLARVQERQSRYQEAADLLASAQAALGDPSLQDSPEWWEEWISIQLARAWIHYWRADMAGMDATDAALAPVVQAHGSPLQRSQFHAARARRGLRQTRYRPDAETLAEAVLAMSVLEPYPDEFLRAETAFLLGFTQLWAERLDDASAALGRALDICRRFGDSTHRLRSLVYLSIARRRQGDVEAVRQENAEAQRLMALLGTDEYAFVAHSQEAWLAWCAGDFAGAEAALEECLRLTQGRFARMPFQWTALWVKLALDAAHRDLDGAADCASLMLQPPLARLQPDVETQLQRVVTARADHDPSARLEQEIATALDLARRAGYL
jgi:tetratricopeptide (TPR) repeat protein